MMSEITWEHAAPAWLVAAALAAAAAATVYSHVRHLRAQRAYVPLLLLRLIFLAVLAWCLLMPVRQRLFTEAVRPRFIVALDTSASMAQTPARFDGTNRWGVAGRVLTQDWTRRIEAECQVDVFALDSEPSLLPELAAAERLKPEGVSTHLREGLRRILDRYKGQPPAGLLLLSDGLDTREVHGDWAKGNWPCPIYTVALEPAGLWEAEPDVRVEMADTPRRVVVGWDTKLRAVVAGQGLRGKPFGVRIFKDGAIQETLPAQLPDEGGSREVTFRLTHPQIGSYTYTVVVPPLPGEIHTNDNRFAINVQVVDARNRLLYAEGPPRWESKYLVRELLGNRNVTPVAFVRGPGGKFISYGRHGDVGLDMTDDQLGLFKIVILGDLDAEALGEARAEALVRMVEHGGSLVLLGGPCAWGAKGFSATALRKLLPFERAWVRPPDEGVFATVLTDEGRAHPIFSADTNGWRNLPPVLTLFAGAKPSAGATVLVEARTGSGSEPLLVAQKYGQGKVLAVLTDSLWRWQLNPGSERPYARFWSQVIEWLSPTERPLEKYELDLFADAGQLFMGEEITLKARLSGGDKEPPGAASVTCEVQTPDDRRVPLIMARQDLGLSERRYEGYALNFTPAAGGLYRAVASVEIEGHRVESPPFSFFVKAFTPEGMPRAADAALLATLAQSSGGRYCEPDEVNTVLSGLRFEARREQRMESSTLWQTVPAIACLIGLLAVEWLWRRLKNLV